MNTNTAGRFKMLAAAGLSALAVLSGCGGKDAKDKSVPAPDTVAAAIVTDTIFTDKRDGKTYKKVTIGKQVWFARNLDYETEGSKCYENSPDSCAKYGHLYDYSTAATSCPAGWHLPTDDEWDVLMVSVGGVEDDNGDWQGAGKQLKSTSGWNKGGNGTDNYGFSALPGGSGDSDGFFINAGDCGLWWSATEDNASNAWYRSMYYSYEDVLRDNYGKTDLFSVRCAQD